MTTKQQLQAVHQLVPKSKATQQLIPKLKATPSSKATPLSKATPSSNNTTTTKTLTVSKTPQAKRTATSTNPTTTSKRKNTKKFKKTPKTQQTKTPKSKQSVDSKAIDYYERRAKNFVMHKPKTSQIGSVEYETNLNNELDKIRKLKSSQPSKSMQRVKHLNIFMPLVTLFEFGKNAKHKIPVKVVNTLLLGHPLSNLECEGKFLYF